MTDNKHRKAAARKAAADKGISLAAQVREHREATKAMPAATLPAPIAIQLARHLRATGFHLSEIRKLAAGERLIPDSISTISRRDEPTGPYAVVDTVLDAVHNMLTELWVWAERTAHASGAIPIVPDMFDKDPAQDRARDILYPKVEDGWCARGGTMPGPGDEHQVAEKNTRTGVRYSLPGPVPTKTMTRHASNTSDAKQIVAGTPAQPVWDAYDDMHVYLSAWMDRAGDSPADLAAALDGLRELASDLPDAVGHITREVTRRLTTGRITGVDAETFAAATAEFDTHFNQKAKDGVGRLNHVRGALWRMRDALDGATAVLTSTHPDHVLAKKFDGEPPAVIREALGTENFVQRHIEKTRPGDHTRAGQLTAMLDFVHAAGLPTYDATQHRAAAVGSFRQLPTDQQWRIPKTTTKGFVSVEMVDDDTDQPSDWSTVPTNYTGHQALVVLQDTATGCWRGWTDVHVADSKDMWNPTIDGEYFVGHLNESRLVMTVGDQAAALLDELPEPVGSVHEDGPEWNCLVCHDTEQAKPPTTLRQLEHQAHRVRAAFERRAGLGMGEGAMVHCAGHGGVLVATLAFTGRTARSRLLGFEWSADRGWTAIVRRLEGQDYAHAMPLRGGELFEPAAVVVVATQLRDFNAWRPARVAEEIQRAISFYV